MRVRVVSACAVTDVAASFLSPVSARAAGQNTIYVNGASSACASSGGGFGDLGTVVGTTNTALPEVGTSYVSFTVAGG